MLRTKIVCTIGPASRSPEMLREMIASGMNVARLNFSHGDQDYHAENIARIRKASEEVGKPVAILTDLQGPKLRVGEMEGEGILLSEGEEVILTIRPIAGHAGEIPVQYSALPRLVQPGDRILMDDGLLEVVVLSSTETDIRCKVITGGLLQSNKGMNLPRAHTSIPAITEKDKKDLAFALEHHVDWIALSFVRNANEVIALQELIQRQCAFGRPTPVIAKIEKPEAMKNIDAIIAAADGIMVARGDLGIEASPEEVPMMQKEIIKKCNEAGVPVITATQMLESMIHNPRPTRAEASDVANAILDGTDAIMLSGETAIGRYPLEALHIMVKIAQRTEAEILRTAKFFSVPPPKTKSIAEAVSHATCETARDLDAAAIITPTVSGYTAHMVAKYRPHMPIVAVTPSPMVQRQLCLYWGVYPLLAPRTANTDQMLADAIHAAREHGYVQPGELIVATGGAAGSAPGTTNLIKVQEVERILATGVGIGSSRVQGQLKLIRDILPNPQDITSSDILVVRRTTREHVPLARRAGGLIVEEGGMDSHAAQMALELGLTAIIGAQGALSSLQDGQIVTLDPIHGRVYEGRMEM
nr:pyruvate kinase [Chloroflexota bacterium]